MLMALLTLSRRVVRPVIHPVLVQARYGVQMRHRIGRLQDLRALTLGEQSIDLNRRLDIVDRI